MIPQQTTPSQPVDPAQHRREACERLSPIGQKYFYMVEFDDNEQLLQEVRKHWFGRVVLEFTGLMISAAIAVITVLLSKGMGDDFGDLAPKLFVMIGLFMAILGVGVTAVLSILYRNNVIYVTNEKLAELQYKGIFNRNISQLSIGDVQDITVKQNGPFPYFFNYGTLTIETSGEQQNYTFTYVPNPHETCNAIVQAHEDNMKLYGN